MNFGNGPLSNLLVVDAASLFVPICVYNNKDGEDARLCARFSEPTWNNPVIRYLDAAEKDLIPRRDGIWTTEGTLERMVDALKAAGRDLPKWLRTLDGEMRPKRRETLVFAMYCYWEGEKQLGALDGVLRTAIGSLKGREVVEVEFDPTVLSREALIRSALKMDCARRIFARTEDQAKTAKELSKDVEVHSGAIHQDTQQQYHLFHHPEFHYLPLTPLQATRVNAALASGTSPAEWLTPTQLALSGKIAKLDQAAIKSLKKLQPARSLRGLEVYQREVESQLNQ